MKRDFKSVEKYILATANHLKPYGDKRINDLDLFLDFETYVERMNLCRLNYQLKFYKIK